MASVKVAVRVRPFNQRERDMNAKLIVQMEGKKTKLLTVKNSKEQIEAGREKYKDFTFDHSYWSYDSGDAEYASQEQVFSDLGLDVIDSAFEGYNACVFAYGQTGSGKTFTMMGSPDSQGLIPRICRQLFSRVAAGKESGASYRTEVSYLEIYNERVKDLLATDAGHSLRVREHPKLGPYVQDLSKHLVSDYDDIQECMHRGNLHRTTASTQMNDVSSRSHAIFTITFVQASYLRHNNMPSETVSKVHLVDLAGSERADATGATGQRLVEGAHINKSLVTLGSVISALAEAAHAAPDGRSSVKKKVFIPYRDSVLTWLLKDSLGGNSKTIMIAAISPADVNYGETLSTLRYANRAKNIINKPTINEDPNVKLIRELREEIDNLRKQISYNTDPVETEADVLATLQRKEAQEKVLTEKWTEKWRETQQILHEQKALGLRKSGLGVVLDSDMPHLVGIDDNLLSTGVTLYHLKVYFTKEWAEVHSRHSLTIDDVRYNPGQPKTIKERFNKLTERDLSEGETVIGSAEHSPTPDIVLSGAGVLPMHCRVALRDGVATISPAPAAQCWLNTVLLDRPAKLSQGCILLLGRTNMFRYNDPAEAAKLREGGAPVNLSRLSLLSWSATDLAASTENLNSTISDLESEIRCERIEAQRAELERERRQFELQQRERQRRWHAEREQLQLAQKQLDEERSAMEREYTAACRRLSGEWRSLERGWALRRRALRCRQRDLAARAASHAAAADRHARAIEKEEPELAELQERLEGQRRSNEEFVRNEIKELVERGRIEQSLVPSPDEPDELLRLLRRSAPALGEALDAQAGAAEALRRAAAARAGALAAHRARLRRLTADLAVLAAARRGLDAALAEGGPEPPPAAVKRSRSELSLRARTEPDDSSADERGHLRNDRLSLSLSLDPLPSPNCLSPDTFHTATSSPGDAPEPTSSTEASTLPDDPVPASKVSPRESPPPASPPIPRFRLGPAADDSDDTSSTEDYHKPRVVEGQSSSSLERAPEDRQRQRHRRRTNDGKNRRQVTEAEALRAMQRLCARIASQKMLVISSLENDCSKEELNRQIAVLQELQKKYVRLEMALQYSFFDGQPKRTIMVTPIQETPSLTLSESDMQVATEPATTTTTTTTTKHRLKEVEIEASDNVSTSNDELPETTWSDPLRAPSHRRDRNNEHEHEHRHEHEHERRDRDHGEHHRGLDRNQYGRNQNHRQSIQSIPLALSDYPQEGLNHPIDFSEVVSVCGWVTRGAGARTHHEYEVRVRLPAAAWALLRRYRRFRDLYLAARALYGEKVAAIPFPARALWSSEALARARRAQLETFLRRLLAVCSTERRCPLHAAPLTGDSLVAFSPFFRKGVFESGKCGTG